MFNIKYLTDEYVPLKSGRKVYLINDEPKDLEVNPMRREKKLSNGYYMETNSSTQGCKNKIKLLLELRYNYNH